MDGSERRVAVVGDDSRASELRGVIGDIADRAGGTPPITTNADDAAVIVAVGREALRETVVSAPRGTVLPVGRSRLALDAGQANRVLRRFLGGSTPEDSALRGSSHDAGDTALGVTLESVDGVRRVSQPLLAVDGASASPRAALDVAFVTDSPARISEFAIEFAYGTPATFRADGVVVATPLGSDGYANAAGAPIVEPGGGLAVAPIAPFRTQTSSWVAASELTVTVEREEEPVTLVIDGTNHGIVEPNRPVAIETADRVDIVASTPRPERGDRKHSNNS